jgi:hypothetical protein
MPSISELGRSEAPGVEPAFKPKDRAQEKITLGFNLALFAYSAVQGLIGFLFSGRARNTPLMGLILTCGLDFVRFTVILLITAGLLQAFWRRLVTSLGPVRPLDFQEAVAIVLMISILFGS